MPGRVFRGRLVATLDDSGDTLVLRSPKVGLFRGAPSVGRIVTAGACIGELEVLGVFYELVAPRAAAGRVVALHDEGRARAPVDHGAALVTLDPDAASAVVEASTTQAATSAGGIAFPCPMSGRFYTRPSPDKPAFVSTGDELVRGQTVCLLEVMKTFNRVAYGGDDLPERVRVVAVVPADGDDVDEGAALLKLETVD